MQRFSQKFLPESFNDIWVRNLVRNIGANKIQLRNHAQLLNFYSNLSKLDIFPLYSFPKIWEDFLSNPLKFFGKKSNLTTSSKNISQMTLQLSPAATVCFVRPASQAVIKNIDCSVRLVFFSFLLTLFHFCLALPLTRRSLFSTILTP